MRKPNRSCIQGHNNLRSFGKYAKTKLLPANSWVSLSVTGKTQPRHHVFFPHVNVEFGANPLCPVLRVQSQRMTVISCWRSKSATCPRWKKSKNASQVKKILQVLIPILKRILNIMVVLNRASFQWLASLSRPVLQPPDGHSWGDKNGSSKNSPRSVRLRKVWIAQRFLFQRYLIVLLGI